MTYSPSLMHLEMRTMHPIWLCLARVLLVRWEQSRATQLRGEYTAAR